MLMPLRSLEPPAELIYFVRQHVVTAGFYDPSEKPHLNVVPVLVQPVDDQFAAIEAPRAAVTRDISPKSVGIVHSAPFRHTLLALQLSLDEEVVCLVAEVQWRMGLGPYHYSGGNYIARLDRFPLYAPAALDGHPAWRRHILVVDDSSISALVVQSNLEHAGYQVTTACDGREAWMKAQEQQFDLILIDNQMPAMDGTQLCRLLRIHELYRETPLVLFTTKGELSCARGLQEDLNVVVNICKSFRPTDLLATIESTLSPKKPPQPALGFSEGADTVALHDTAALHDTVELHGSVERDDTVEQDERVELHDPVPQP